LAKLRPVLFTKEALSIDWEGTEWFGSDFSHTPYWEITQASFGYGYFEDRKVIFEYSEELDYILVFKEGEFVVSFEISPALRGEGTVELSGIGNLRNFLKC